MKFDIFLSICQTEVDGMMPSERQMFASFFDQVELADQLGFGTAWVAETHLSCETQKENPGAVIPHFKGEIGLNTDILQLAHLIFARTKKINVGSAIRNIVCNGGPVAHAESIRTFLALHDLNPSESRKLEIGFAAGRFPFSNNPYGFKPTTALEKAGWDVIRNKYFQEATEIFLRLLRGEKISSREVSPKVLTPRDFRKEADWQKVQAIDHQETGLLRDQIPLPHHWQFEKLGLIPADVSLRNLRLTLGSHDPETQILANSILPTGVFNLSITPDQVIQETHERLKKAYHSSGGPWRRELLPRTLMLFLDATPGLSPAEQSAKAKHQARSAWENYWKAMEGTLDPAKVESAVGNSVAGNAQEVTDLIRQKYHPDDRLMLWFDFNNHDNESVKASMRAFMQKVAPGLSTEKL